MAISNRYKTQSIAVNEEELEAIKQLAEKVRLKPAALARELFYRGLSEFLNDGTVHAKSTDDEIFRQLVRYLATKHNVKLSGNSSTEKATEIKQNHLFSSGGEPRKTKPRSRKEKQDIQDVKKDARERTQRKLDSKQ